MTLPSNKIEKWKNDVVKYLLCFVLAKNLHLPSSVVESSAVFCFSGNVEDTSDEEVLGEIFTVIWGEAVESDEDDGELGEDEYMLTGELLRLLPVEFIIW